MLSPFLQVFSKGHSISCAGPHESATCPTKPVAVVATKPSSKTPTGSKASSKPGKPSKVKSSANLDVDDPMEAPADSETEAVSAHLLFCLYNGLHCLSFMLFLRLV